MKYNVLNKALNKAKISGDNTNLADIMACSSLCDFIKNEELLKNRLSDSLKEDLIFLVKNYEQFSDLRDDVQEIVETYDPRNTDLFYRHLKEEAFISKDDDSEDVDILEIVSSRMLSSKDSYDFFSKKKISAVISSWLTEDKSGLTCFCPFNSMLDIEDELSLRDSINITGFIPNNVIAKRIYLCCKGNKVGSCLLLSPERINEVAGSYDVGFSFPPLLMRLKGTADTLEIKLIEDMLKRISGKFCVITFSGLTNSGAKGYPDFRKKLLNSGKLFAVAELPGGFVPYSGVTCTALFFDCNQKENSHISFVDISRSECKDTKNSGRTQFEFNDYAVESLKKCLSNGKSELIEKISIDDISKNDFILTPSRYVLPKEVREARNKILEGDTKLSDVVEFYRTLTTKSEDQGEPYFEVSASDINQMGVIETPSKQILQTEDNVAKRNLLKKGDIIFAIKGSVGKVGLVAEEHSNWLLNQSFVILRVKNKNWPVEYVFRQLKSSAMKYYIQSMTIGSVIPSLAMSDLKNIPLVSPEKEKVEDQRIKHERQLEITLQLKQLQTELEQLNDF